MQQGGGYPPPQQSYGPPPQGYAQGQPMQTYDQNNNAWAPTHSPPQQQGGSHQTVNMGADAAVMGEPIFPECQDPMIQKNFRKQGAQDVWAAVLFAVNVIAAIVVGAINLQQGKLTEGTSTSTSASAKKGLEELRDGCLTAMGISVVLCLLLLVVVRAAPVGFLHFTMISFVVLWIVVAVIGFINNDANLGIIGILLALVAAAVYWCWKGLIPLSGLLLKISITACFEYWGIFIASLFFTLLTLGWYVMWVAMAFPTLRDVGNSSGALGLQVVFVFMLFWVIMTNKAIVAITAAGIVGVRFFIPSGQAPESATTASLGRATTTSLGSAAFGGLVLAILKTLEYLARSAASRGRGGACACIAHCVIACITRIMEILNAFSYSYIGIHGCSFIEGSKMTWELIKKSRLAAVIPHLLVERVFALCIIVVTVISAVVVFFVFDKSFYALFGAILVSISVGNIMFYVVESATNTQLVCVVEYDQLFRQLHPQYSREFDDAIRSMEQGPCSGGDDGDDGY